MTTKTVLALVLVPFLGACARNGVANQGGDMTPMQPPTDDGGMLIGCGAQSQRAQVVPIDMVLALDTSYSMDFDGKWPAVKAALKGAFGDAQFTGLGFALQYFPLRAQCNVSDYATPAVPLATLPAAAAALDASLDLQRMSGGTPTVPMLQGVLAYAQARALADPTRKVVILLATDGIPDDSCSAPPDGGVANSLANVVTIAAGAAAGTPKIQTFVIGVGSDLTALNQIATAGGTGSAFLVDTAADIESEFRDAITKIRRNAVGCDYQIPPPSMGLIDFTKVNVQFHTASGTTTFLYAHDAASCASKGGGWYYDDPAHPTKVLLCDSTCQQVQARDDGQLDIVFGCKTFIQ